MRNNQNKNLKKKLENKSFRIYNWFSIFRILMIHLNLTAKILILVHKDLPRLLVE